MKRRDALFMLLVCALALAGIAGLAAIGPDLYSTQMPYARHADFDALAYLVFGGGGAPAQMSP